VRLIPAARAVNDGMPLHLADLTAEALRAAGLPIAGARVAVLGYAYLENSDDTRNSPSAAFADRLRAQGAEVLIHDPWVAEYQGDLFDCVSGADAAAVLVGHQAYRALDLDGLRAALRTPILIDGRGLFAPEQVAAAGLAYRGVGYGVPAD
jgi:UDP-N-acetyl-D-mannosaminuronic acid dehydrogenase